MIIELIKLTVISRISRMYRECERSNVICQMYNLIVISPLVTGVGTLHVQFHPEYNENVIHFIRGNEKLVLFNGDIVL